MARTRTQTRGSRRPARTVALTAIGGLVLSLGVALGPAMPAAAASTVELVSIGPGGETSDGHSNLQDVAADGSTLFLSTSRAMANIPGTYPNWARLYLRSGNITTALTPLPSFSVEAAGISENGRWIVYLLVHSIYLYDTSDASLHGVLDVGDFSYGIGSTRIDVSDNGRFVVFDTTKDLDPADTNTVADVYRYDRTDAVLTLLSVNPDATPSNGASRFPRATPDGSAVVFGSTSSTLVPGDTNGVSDVFVWTDGPTLERVSTDATDTQLARGANDQADISDDGRLVAFSSADFAASGIPGLPAVVLKDRQTESIEVVSSAPGFYDDFNPLYPTLNGDATRIAYQSDWRRMTTGPQGDYSDVVVKDRTTNSIELASVAQNGGESGGQAANSGISGAGDVVAFDGWQNDYVPGAPPGPSTVGGVTSVYRATVTFGDSVPPSATITAAADGATYDLAATVLADFTCTDNVALAVTDPCVGDVAVGSPIDTSSTGPKTFDVTATDAAGLSTTVSATYTVAPTLAAGLALSGTISTIPAGYTVSAVDAGTDGVTVTVTGVGTAKVVLSVCGGFIVRIAPGSSVTLACGSVIAHVIAAPVPVEVERSTSSGPVVMTVPAGGFATLTNNADVIVAPTSTGTVTVTSGGVTQPVAPGATTTTRLVGFRQPIDMGGVWNVVKAGSAVPVKFEVFYGSVELTSTTVLAPMTSVQVACPRRGTYDLIEELAERGAPALRYDTRKGYFVAVWKAPKTRNTCQQITVTTTSGVQLSALFKLV